jgi:hypothetical protein
LELKDIRCIQGIIFPLQIIGLSLKRFNITERVCFCLFFSILKAAILMLSEQRLRNENNGVLFRQKKSIVLSQKQKNVRQQYLFIQ